MEVSIWEPTDSNMASDESEVTSADALSVMPTSGTDKSILSYMVDGILRCGWKVVQCKNR